jgi:hypothetical protein
MLIPIFGGVVAIAIVGFLVANNVKDYLDD